MLNDTGQRYFTTPLCGEDKHVDIPEREHPLDAYTVEQLDRYQTDLGDPRVTIAPREYDFVAARERLEAKPKSAGAEARPRSRTRSRRVKDGDHVALGGCLFSRTPLALVRALLRRRPHGPHLLAQPHVLRGRVVHGRGRGEQAS